VAGAIIPYPAELPIEGNFFMFPVSWPGLLQKSKVGSNSFSKADSKTIICYDSIFFTLQSK
jgi:hypothetical protein